MTPLQKLIKQFEEIKDSNLESSIDVGFAISLAKSLLEKEKEVMVDFAYKFGDEPLSEIPKWYDKQFNTEEEEIHPDSVYGQWMKRMNGE